MTSSRRARCTSPDGAASFGVTPSIGTFERWSQLKWRAQLPGALAGFLGLAHSHYPVPWSALKYDTGLGGFRTGITEEQLRDAPEFSDDSWTDRNWETRTHQHYGASPYWGA